MVNNRIADGGNGDGDNSRVVSVDLDLLFVTHGGSLGSLDGCDGVATAKNSSAFRGNIGLNDPAPKGDSCGIANIPCNKVRADIENAVVPSRGIDPVHSPSATAPSAVFDKASSAAASHSSSCDTPTMTTTSSKRWRRQMSPQPPPRLQRPAPGTSQKQFQFQPQQHRQNQQLHLSGDGGTAQQPQPQQQLVGYPRSGGSGRVIPVLHPQLRPHPQQQPQSAPIIQLASPQPPQAHQTVPLVSPYGRLKIALCPSWCFVTVASCHFFLIASINPSGFFVGFLIVLNWVFEQDLQLKESCPERADTNPMHADILLSFSMFFSRIFGLEFVFYSVKKRLPGSFSFSCGFAVTLGFIHHDLYLRS